MQEQLQTKLFTIANDHEQTIAEITPLLACIDFDALDGVETGLYDELRSCMEPIDTALENGVATCDWSECEIQCDREEAQTKIHLALFEGMCQLEYRIQSRFLLFTCMQVQYWFLVFTRGLLLQGCLLLYWKKLRPPTVKLKYDYDVDEGRAVHIDMDDDGIDKTTKAAIEGHLKHERNQGYLKFAFAFLLNVPWIALIIYFKITGDPFRPKWMEA